MQSSHLNSSGDATNEAVGCCAANATDCSSYVGSSNRDTNKTRPMIDAQAKRDTTVTFKTSESSTEAQVGLGKESAFGSDMDRCQTETFEVHLSDAAASEGSHSVGDVCQNSSAGKEILKTQNAAFVSTQATHNSNIAEGLSSEISWDTNAVLGNKATECKVDEICSSTLPLSDSHAVTLQPYYRGESKAYLARNAHPSDTLPDKTHSNIDFDESMKAKGTSSGIASTGIALSAGFTVPPSSAMSTGSSMPAFTVSTTSSTGTLSSGNTVSHVSSVSAGSTSLTSDTLSAGGCVSAASRRSSFFNEPSKATGPGVVPQLSAVTSSRIPISLVSERAKQFERGLMRKVGIEVKSRSLDPPYSCDAVTSQTAGCERLAARQLLPSALARQETTPRNVALTAESVLSCDNISTDDDHAVAPECVWIRRASSDRFDFVGIKNDVSHDAFDQKPNQNSTSIGTPMGKAGNIQKLKAFFGETTPRIMEAKAGPRCVVEEPTGDGCAVAVESKKDCDAKCDAASAAAAAQKSLTFDPASWALERMARGKKAAAWTLASRSHSSHSPGSIVRPKKSSTERDPSSSPKQKEHKTWKGKMAETFKRYGSGPTAPGVEYGPSEEVTGTFGITLELLPPCLVNEFVPSVVEMCIRVVEERGLDNQGIYRVPGNSGALNAMIDELNKDPHGLCMESEKWSDVNLVSSMLKLFFRKLPDPLITDELYEAVIAANRTENSERRMLKLKKLIHDLPEHNFETLRFLAQHLNKVASHEEVNKMDAHNLAIVFGPTLVRPQDDTMVVMVRDMADQCRVVESIIVHCDWFFSSWDEDVYVPIDEGAEDATPISGMNQELLAKAERLDKRSSLSF